MKRKTGILVTLGSLSLAIFASIIPPPYDKSKAPPLTLPAAYAKAMTILGQETNTYHCVRAEVNTTFSEQGDWYFSFYPDKTNAIPRFVFVTFAGKADLDNGAR